MHFLHHEFDVGPDDVIEVYLDGPANVLLLDSSNFQLYQEGQIYRYQGGGYVKTSPVRLSPPYHGHWHVVINLGGFAGKLRAGVRVLEPQAAR